MKKDITRHQAREIAVQFLYQADINEKGLVNNLDDLQEERSELDLVDTFLAEIIEGTYQKIDKIDQLIDQNIEDWKMKRIAKVDRNVIRLAVYEILEQSDIPVAVSINEAVELAKSFSNQQSAKFVNGILGRLVDKLNLDTKEE